MRTPLLMEAAPQLSYSVTASWSSDVLELHVRIPEWGKPIRENDWSHGTILPEKALLIILNPRIKGNDEPRLLIAHHPGLIGLQRSGRSFSPDRGCGTARGGGCGVRQGEWLRPQRRGQATLVQGVVKEGASHSPCRSETCANMPRNCLGRKGAPLVVSPQTWSGAGRRDGGRDPGRRRRFNLPDRGRETGWITGLYASHGLDRAAG